MAFQKGNKLGGRKKGVQNKVTTDIKQNLNRILELLSDKLANEDNVDSMSLRNSSELFANLLKYYMPTMSAIKQDTTHDGEITIKVEYQNDNGTEDKTT